MVFNILLKWVGNKECLDLNRIFLMKLTRRIPRKTFDKIAGISSRMNLKLRVNSFKDLFNFSAIKVCWWPTQAEIDC
jgi:hypothetical protein